jgi:hypothetical protein
VKVKKRASNLIATRQTEFNCRKTLAQNPIASSDFAGGPFHARTSGVNPLRQQSALQNLQYRFSVFAEKGLDPIRQVRRKGLLKRINSVNIAVAR